MRLQVTVALVALALLSGQAGRSRTITLSPDEIPEGAKDFRLAIRRTDGQPFTAQANSPLYVGIAFGTTLVKLKATPDEAQSPRSLTIEIEDLNAKWDPVPRAGDTLLVAVYHEDKPITAATHLRVIASARAHSNPAMTEDRQGRIRGAEEHGAWSMERGAWGCVLLPALCAQLRAPDRLLSDADDKLWCVTDAGLWWVLMLAVMLLGGGATMIYRTRVARLLELERVRTRIAADLHDDIGASLSEMALLSEVLKQKYAVTQPDSLDTLTQIAERARGLVDTMSDVVWAIDPRLDNLSTVILRISELASEVLEVTGIACEIHAPPEPEKVKLTPEQRRHLFLIFKEAFTNIVHHSSCRRASLTVSVSDHRLVAEIQDDGCGCANLPLGEEVRQSRGGHGLENMQARAAELGGQLRIESASGQGTRLTLAVPLK